MSHQLELRALRIIYGGSRFNNDYYASYCAELGIETLRVRRDLIARRFFIGSSSQPAACIASSNTSQTHMFLFNSFCSSREISKLFYFILFKELLIRLISANSLSHWIAWLAPELLLSIFGCFLFDLIDSIDYVVINCILAT